MSLIDVQKMPKSLQPFFKNAVTECQIDQAAHAMSGPYMTDEVVAFVFRPPAAKKSLIAKTPLFRVVPCDGLAGHNDVGSSEVDMTELTIGEMATRARDTFYTYATRNNMLLRRSMIVAFDTSRTASPLISSPEAQVKLARYLDLVSRPWTGKLWGLFSRAPL